MICHSAILLLGPTGAGKTPLGDWLATHGWRGRRCVHFDFGANLRRVAEEGGVAWGLDAAAVGVVRDVLAAGSLLEDHQFPIARQILETFVDRHQVGAGDCVILNGLPRHAGQAAALDACVRVGLVVALACAPDVVRQRIAANAGGDRARRIDDGPEQVARKLALYAARTEPLIDHYRKKGVSIRAIVVTVPTQPKDVARILEVDQAAADGRGNDA